MHRHDQRLALPHGGRVDLPNVDVAFLQATADQSGLLRVPYQYPDGLGDDPAVQPSLNRLRCDVQLSGQRGALVQKWPRAGPGGPVATVVLGSILEVDLAGRAIKDPNRIVQVLGCRPVVQLQTLRAAHDANAVAT